MRSFFFPLFSILAIFYSSITCVQAEEYYWIINQNESRGHFVTPKEACDEALDTYATYACPSYGPTVCRPSVLKKGRSMTFIYVATGRPRYSCDGIINYTSYDPDSELPDTYFEGLQFTNRYGDECPPGTSENPTTGICGNDPQKGPTTCEESAGTNPINVLVGNKFQSETDYSTTGTNPLRFTRAYNSLDGLWRYSYSTSLRILPHTVAVVFTDGREAYFSIEDETISAIGSESGTLSQESEQWRYRSPDNQDMVFDSEGRLLSINSPNTSILLSYEDERVIISNQRGVTMEVTLREDKQPLSVQVAGKEITFTYTDDHLVSVTYPDGASKTYHYEDSRFPNALTGITDENGARYATWAYDDEGRAISSEHANGVDKVTIDYTYQKDSTDSRVTVTNPLGKQATYHFTTIHGISKVTQVEGHPTASCEGANKAYSYDANGNVISKTDWNGIETTYTYDMDRNLELSRTEAAGTPEERTITTEWHPDYRLPVKVTEPDRITEYTYDAQGHLLSSKTSSVQ